LSVAPEISVVIPAYNEAERLPETIEKIKRYLTEKALPFELIAVDDGSSDETAERAAQAIGTLGRVIRLGRVERVTPPWWDTGTKRVELLAWAELEGPLLVLLRARVNVECDDEWEVIAWVD